MTCGLVSLRMRNHAVKWSQNARARMRKGVLIKAEEESRKHFWCSWQRGSKLHAVSFPSLRHWSIVWEKKHLRRKPFWWGTRKSTFYTVSWIVQFLTVNGNVWNCLTISICLRKTPWITMGFGPVPNFTGLLTWNKDGMHKNVGEPASVNSLNSINIKWAQYRASNGDDVSRILQCQMCSSSMHTYFPFTRGKIITTLWV